MPEGMGFQHQCDAVGSRFETAAFSAICSPRTSGAVFPRPASPMPDMSTSCPRCSMLIAAFVSAFNMRPHWVQWNTAWLSRFSLHVWPHWQHCWLVYAGLTSRRLLAYARLVLYSSFWRMPPMLAERSAWFRPRFAACPFGRNRPGCNGSGAGFAFLPMPVRFRSSSTIRSYLETSRRETCCWKSSMMLCA